MGGCSLIRVCSLIRSNTEYIIIIVLYNMSRCRAYPLCGTCIYRNVNRSERRTGVALYKTILPRPLRLPIPLPFYLDLTGLPSHVHSNNAIRTLGWYQDKEATGTSIVLGFIFCYWKLFARLVL